MFDYFYYKKKIKYFPFKFIRDMIKHNAIIFQINIKFLLLSNISEN